jgi:hypothetical protein
MQQRQCTQKFWQAGTLPIEPVDFPGIPALGVYPNLLGLVLPAPLLLIISGVFVYTHYSARATRRARALQRSDYGRSWYVVNIPTWM